ncbi:MAG: hypothetical protein KC978_17115, partial [Candidatus Omnitrophica bacterium]|nr:hypothetical protein [Candidatus Omnitrophota bacterium]
MRRLTIDLMQTVGSILVLLLLTFSQEVRSEDLTALVTAANGKVAYYMENTKELQPVKVGTTRLTTGYVLMTGPNSRATLEIEGKHTAADSVHPEKTTVEIDAKSKVRMETLLTDVTTQGESVKLGVGQGRVICNVRKINTQSERFEVQ